MSILDSLLAALLNFGTLLAKLDPEPIPAEILTEEEENALYAAHQKHNL